LDLRPVVLPQTIQALSYSAHARSAGTATFATVIATRLPRAGAKSSVYLVSLEGHYDANGFIPSASGQDFVSFVVLASWRFTCLSVNAGVILHRRAGGILHHG
jgi:hypothetical protein